MVDSAVAQVRHLGTSRRRGVSQAQKVCIGAHPSCECADTGRSGPFVSLCRAPILARRRLRSKNGGRQVWFLPTLFYSG